MGNFFKSAFATKVGPPLHMRWLVIFVGAALSKVLLDAGYAIAALSAVAAAAYFVGYWAGREESATYIPDKD